MPVLVSRAGDGAHMTPDERGTGSEIVLASVYLRSPSGASLLRMGRGRPRDLRAHLPDQATIEQAVAALEARGFTIAGRGVTISISGSPALFEEVCGVRLTKVEGRQPGQPHYYRSSEEVMHIKGLEQLIDGIVLVIPGVPFR
jgi:hypothetical protein